MFRKTDKLAKFTVLCFIRFIVKSVVATKQQADTITQIILVEV